MLKTWLRLMVAAITIGALVACGGGGQEVSSLPTTQGVVAPQWDFAKATQSETLLGGARKQALAATSATTITVNELFDWAEKEYSFLFPKGPVTQRTTYLGNEYEFRYYQPTDNYLGVRPNGDVYGFGKFTSYQLVGFGNIGEYRCWVKPSLCGGGTPEFAGNLVFSSDGGTHLSINPNYVGGKLTWLGADGKGYDIASSEVEQVCARSNRLGNWGKRGGAGCNRPQDNGELKIVGLPTNDQCVQFTLWTKSGQEYWFNTGDAQGWHFSGLGAKASACGIEYGDFKPAKISAVREADGTATLVWDFGSDFFAGFFGRDGQSIRLEAGKVYAFALNGERQGKSYGAGWGLGDNRKTPAGDKIEPSIKMAWLEPVDSRLVLKFKGLACSDKVNVTIYAGTGPVNNVSYDFAADGFGLGWAGLPYQEGVSLWTAGEGVTFDRVKGQVQYAVPFCTQK